MVYNPQVVDAMCRAMGAKPPSPEQHTQRQLASIDRQMARERRRAAVVASRAAGGEADTEASGEEIKLKLLAAVTGDQSPLAKALSETLKRADPEATQLWPATRGYLIRAARQLIEADPSISRDVILEHFRDVIPRIFKAMGIDGLNPSKEAQELAVVAMEAAPLLRQEKPAKPKAVAPDGQELTQIQPVAALSHGGNSFGHARKGGRDYFGPIYMTHSH